MARVWRNEEATKEGKYPIVLRRDGTVFREPHFLIALRDPCAPPAFLAYAAEAERLGLDPAFVADMRAMAQDATTHRLDIGPGDPDAKPHRKDNSLVLDWANGRLWDPDKYPDTLDTLISYCLTLVGTGAGTAVQLLDQSACSLPSNVRDQRLCLDIPERDEPDWDGEYRVRMLRRSGGPTMVLRSFGEDRDAAIAFALELMGVLYPEEGIKTGPSIGVEGV